MSQPLRTLLALLMLAVGSTLSPAWGLQITGLKNPYSFVSDTVGDQYFISNVNGDPDARDNNGFVTRLDGSGKLTALEFIHGNGQTTLHAPKGMAIVEHRLYVADLDTIQVFDTATGRPVQAVSLSQFGRVALADLAYDGRDTLYASDTDANTIYKLGIAQQTVSVFLKSPALHGPRGLALHPHTGHLIVASWQKGKILEVDAGGIITELASNSFFSSRFNNLDGVDFDKFGNLYIADTTGGKVWRMRADRTFEVIAEFLNSPADISVDRSKHLILVPYLYANTAEMNGLESPIKSQKQKRTLADYGFGFMDKFKSEQKAKEEAVQK